MEVARVVQGLEHVVGSDREEVGREHGLARVAAASHAHHVDEGVQSLEPAAGSRYNEDNIIGPREEILRAMPKLDDSAYLEY